MKNRKLTKGLSLIEILVVVSIFAVIGILTTRSVFLTIRNSKKSDSLVRVRENVNYSLAVIERQLRNAESITCPNPDTTRINYNSLDDVETSFSCNNIGINGYIASGSGRLTATDISVTGCIFTCSQLDENNPPVVDVEIFAEDNTTTNVEKGTVNVKTSVTLRNY